MIELLVTDCFAVFGLAVAAGREVGPARRIASARNASEQRTGELG
jgi:hypothetical protein